jgi:hypothetical protein
MTMNGRSPGPEQRDKFALRRQGARLSLTNLTPLLMSAPLFIFLEGRPQLKATNSILLSLSNKLKLYPLSLSPTKSYLSWLHQLTTAPLAPCPSCVWNTEFPT